MHQAVRDGADPAVPDELQRKAYASEDAFRRFRGERPSGGYGRDLLEWDYEDRKLRRCWDAAIKWYTEQQKGCGHACSNTGGCGSVCPGEGGAQG